VFGWALDWATFRRPAVSLLADGSRLLTAGGAGWLASGLRLPNALFGFRADIPPNFAAGEAVRLTAAAQTGDRLVEFDRRDVRNPPFGTQIAGTALNLPLTPHKSRRSAASVAAIVLTKDGAALLRGLFESILRHEKDTFRHILVVDHGSADETDVVIRDFGAKLPLALLKTPGDRTFSQSNNLAAEECGEDVLVFLNNDIVLTEPCVAQLVAHLAPDVGLAGLRLMDPPIAGTRLQATQHVGIHFCCVSRGNVIPFESRWMTDAPDANGEAIETPAATAAMIAIRRDRFLELGGFDERYRFGMEDVDLGLRSLAAGFRNVCVNDISAIHIGSATRRRDSRTATRRNRRNLSLLSERWKYFLRRSLYRDQFERPGYWTGRKVHFGFVIAAGPEHGEARQLAEMLGRAFQRRVPAKVFLHELDTPVDAAQLDGIAVLDPAFDPRSLLHVSGTTLLVAVAYDRVEAWPGKSWLEEYDLWFAAPGEASRLSAEIGRAVTPLDFEVHSPGGAEQTADAFLHALGAKSAAGLRVALKRGHPRRDDAPDKWAGKLRGELESLGHVVRLQAGDEPISERADATVFLAPGNPAAQQISILLDPDGGTGAGRADRPAYDDVIRLQSSWTVDAPGTGNPNDAAELAHLIDRSLRRLDAERMSPADAPRRIARRGSGE